MNDQPSEATDLQANLLAIEKAYALVEDDSHSYEGYNALIEGFKAMGNSMAERLQSARVAMSSVLLLSERQWIDWLDDQGFVDEELRPILYSTAVTDVPSVSLWTKYANFLISKYASQEKTYDDVLSIFAEGADVTSYRIPNSHVFWNIYCAFLARNLEDGTKKAATVHLLKELYLKRLAVPHSTISETFSRFSSFITAHENDNYEQEMINANKIYAVTLKAIQVRDQWETTIISDNSLENYAAYIQWEISRPSRFQEPNLVIGLYERVIGDYPRIGAVWDDYVVYLTSIRTSSDVIIKVLTRATKACPESGELWAHYLRAKEMSGESFLDIESTKGTVDLIRVFQFPKHYQDWKVFTMAWLHYLQKKFAESQNEEILERFILDAEVAFSRAVDQAKDDSYFEMEMFLIEQWTILNDFDQVRTIWNRVSKYHGKSSEFWVKWVIWERSHGDYQSTIDVFSKAMSRNNLDWPERVFQSYLEYERAYGSFYSIQQCIAKCRSKQKHYHQLRQREQQKQQQQQEYAQSAEVQEESTIKRPFEEASEGGRPTKLQKKAESKTYDVSRNREKNTVIASNLPDITVEELRNFFFDCGEIKDVILDSVKHTATLEFCDHEGALAAMTRHLKTIGAFKNEIQVQSGEATTLWVTNFPPSATENTLRELFSKKGEVISIRFPSLKFNTHRRFCYIQFSNASEALSAVNDLNGQKMDQEGSESTPLTLVVKISDPSKKTQRAGAIYEDRELFVKGIDFKSVDEARLRSLFEPYGPIERVRLPLSKGNENIGRLHDGYCFIVLESSIAARKAVLDLNGMQLESRTIQVSIAEKSGTKVVSKVVADGNSMGSALPADINARTLLVTNLADTVNDTQLSDVFSKYGPLKQVVLIPKNESASVEYIHVQVSCTSHCTQELMIRMLEKLQWHSRAMLWLERLFMCHPREILLQSQGR